MADALREIAAIFSIDVDTSELKKGHEETESFLTKLKDFGKIAAGAFAVKEIIEFTQSQIEAGAQLKIMAERLGTDTTELQALQLAAADAGVSTDSMNTSLRFLNKNLGEAASGGKEQAAIFQNLGIQIKDSSGNVRSSSEVMGDLADAIQKVPGAAEKTNIAMKLLGRGGTELVPLLNKGGEAFRDARKDLEDLGGGLSTDFVEDAHKAEESMNHLKVGMTSLKTYISIELIPIFKGVTDGLITFVKAAIDVEKKSHIMEDAFKFIKVGVIANGIYKIVAAVRALSASQLIAVATNPFFWLIGGAILALAAYNDLKVAAEGGKSVFTDMFGETGVKELIEDFKALKVVGDGIVAVVGTIVDGIKELGHLAGAAFSEVNVLLDKASSAVFGDSDNATKEDEASRDKSMQEARALGSHAQQRWTDLGKSARKEFGVEEPEDFESERAQARLSQVGSEFPLTTPATYTQGFNATLPPSSEDNNTYNVYNKPGLHGSATKNGASGAGGSVTVNQNNTTKIDIQTSGDPQAIKKVVGSAVATQHQIDHNNAINAYRQP